MRARKNVKVRFNSIGAHVVAEDEWEGSLYYSQSCQLISSSPSLTQTKILQNCCSVDSIAGTH